jgi:hypothetical protein
VTNLKTVTLSVKRCLEPSRQECDGKIKELNNRRVEGQPCRVDYLALFHSFLTPPFLCKGKVSSLERQRERDTFCSEGPSRVSALTNRDLVEF